MRPLRTLLFGALLSVLLFGMAAWAAPEPPPFVVIVNPENRVSSYSRKFLTEAFLKKVSRWSNGELIRPVDQTPSSKVRERFSEDVLGRSVAAVRAYWQQMIFAGRELPPPELESDTAIVSYVLKYPGAVGYVSGSVELRGTRVVEIR